MVGRPHKGAHVSGRGPEPRHSGKSLAIFGPRIAAALLRVESRTVLLAIAGRRSYHEPRASSYPAPADFWRRRLLLRWPGDRWGHRWRSIDRADRVLDYGKALIVLSGRARAPLQLPKRRSYLLLARPGNIAELKSFCIAVGATNARVASIQIAVDTALPCRSRQVPSGVSRTLDGCDPETQFSVGSVYPSTQACDEKMLAGPVGGLALRPKRTEVEIELAYRTPPKKKTNINVCIFLRDLRSVQHWSIAELRPGPPVRMDVEAGKRSVAAGILLLRARGM